MSSFRYNQAMPIVTSAPLMLPEDAPLDYPAFQAVHSGAVKGRISRRVVLGGLVSFAACSAAGFQTRISGAQAPRRTEIAPGVQNALQTTRRHTMQLQNLRMIDLYVSGSPRLARRATVFIPTHGCVGRLPVLVLLHGLGETNSERNGAYAWVQRYGLASSYDRLVHPPVDNSPKKHPFLTSSRALEINRSLTFQPFRGMILVCPYTPNVFEMPTRQAIQDYGAWLVQVLLPEVRARTPALAEPRYTGIDGCSLGGYVSLQVFQQHPEDFYTCGAVQAAFGTDAAAGYASRLRQIIDQYGSRPIHLLTSSLDPYRDANMLLSKHLTRLSVEHQLRVSPGPHNQPWLIDVGTVEMLLWQERNLYGQT